MPEKSMAAPACSERCSRSLVYHTSLVLEGSPGESEFDLKDKTVGRKIGVFHLRVLTGESRSVAEI